MYILQVITLLIDVMCNAGFGIPAMVYPGVVNGIVMNFLHIAGRMAMENLTVRWQQHMSHKFRDIGLSQGDVSHRQLLL